MACYQSWVAICQIYAADGKSQLSCRRAQAFVKALLSLKFSTEVSLLFSLSDLHLRSPVEISPGRLIRESSEAAITPGLVPKITPILTATGYPSLFYLNDSRHVSEFYKYATVSWF